MKESIETFDRRNGIHNLLEPECYAGSEWAFVLPFSSVSVEGSPGEDAGCPVLETLSDFYGEPLVGYAWGLARARWFSESGEVLFPLTMRSDLVGEGMYHFSHGLRLWQAAWRSGEAVLPITLDIDENRRVITLRSSGTGLSL